MYVFILYTSSQSIILSMRAADHEMLNSIKNGIRVDQFDQSCESDCPVQWKHDS